MPYQLREARDEDAAAIRAIFNHFVRTSFAAYPTAEVGTELLPRLRSLAGDHPFIVAESADGRVVGFAFLHPIHSADSLRRTAEVSYFIRPEHTRKGIGTKLLERLIVDARGRGVDSLVASISSENEQSLAFHRRHGFVECGRFQRAGHKLGRDFDLVWMQRML